MHLKNHIEKILKKNNFNKDELTLILKDFQNSENTGFYALLIGESLMKPEDHGLKLKEISGVI